MRIQHLSLANFRAFEQLDLQFEQDVTALAGVNGVGKSAVMEALNVLFSRALPLVSVARARPIRMKNADVRHGSPSVELTATAELGNRVFDMTLQYTRWDEKERDTWRRRLQEIQVALLRAREDYDRTAELTAERGRLEALLGQEQETWTLLPRDLLVETTRTGDLEAPARAAARVMRQLRSAPNQPLVVYFGIGRRLPSRGSTDRPLRALEKANAYAEALQDREVRLREFADWFRVLRSGIAGHDRVRTSVEAALQHAITTFLPGFSNLRVTEASPPQILVDKASTPLALDQLSDGERGILAVLFDITRRLAIANPDTAEPIAQGRALILIDELELHLHPTWQRTVLRRLRDTFKSCQFIVTTHSPQVIGELESRSLRFLIPEDEQTTVWTPPRALAGC